MPIHFVAGDLFTNEHQVQAFAHGCNCQGSMGAGIAKTFRARYPAMYEAYRDRCRAEPRLFNLGTCWLWRADNGEPSVFNLGTQEGYWRSRASYEAIETALRAMRAQADAEQIASMAIPRIGVGYGGLSWRKVRAIVEVVFADWPGRLVVYEDFVPTEAPSKSVGLITSSTPSEEGSVLEPIHFYSTSGPYGSFSNFSPHRVWLKGKIWPTTEHYFQAQKFAGTPAEDEVGFARSPLIAARLGRSRQRPLRPDWEAVKDEIMREAVRAKFTQHDDLRATLLATGTAPIVEHTTNDAYWGDGGDGSGRNRLGQILMEVREELRVARTEDPPE